MLRLHPYRYHRPRELGAALELLERHEGDVMPIAGGTDLMPNMKHGLFTPSHLVALKSIDALHGIEQENGAIRIGAAESLTAISRHPLMERHYPSLARAAGTIAHPMIRNQGTIGGNICLDTRCTYYNQTRFWREALGYCLKKDGDVCHVIEGGTRCVAAHSADTPPILMTLQAEVEIASTTGTRRVPMADFFVADGIWNRVLEPGELVTQVRVPVPSPGLYTSYQKLRERKSVDFPILSVALALEFAEDDTITAASMVVSALGAKPRQVGHLEGILVGEKLGPQQIEGAAEQAHRQSHPLDNIIVESDWRRAMVPVYVRRAFREIADRRRAAA